MRAVISVVGHDRTGILAFIATKCAERGINIIDVTQKVLREFFTMIMIVEMPENCGAGTFSELKELGEREGLQIHVMHEDIFNSMHTI